MRGQERARRGRALLAGGVLVATVLTGCGSGDGRSAPQAAPSSGPALGTVTTAPDGVQEVTLQTQDDYVFSPATFTVAPGPVRLTVVNVAEQMTHNFRFTPDAGPAPIDPEIPLLTPGESRTIEFTVSTPGEYGFECSFHTQLDQYGVMTVSG
ncbi:plastocyanin/azurin family copper-binding protein [Geodermatophilus sp. DSM 45219]|uniref:plastocyanin/azurin family copper-binding protein n=1 Tax=Geodermatophilus sp. DSM 45219 TaxID=1881103 RepID=UPI00088C16CA|nr:plastocyanin/azurin family copper-binding protein [Geodermatophilus sp. DSM 45219]SDN52295.1 Plastocyanin [Geodermatophilus sp. DSM 45219]